MTGEASSFREDTGQRGVGSFRHHLGPCLGSGTVYSSLNLPPRLTPVRQGRYQLSPDQELGYEPVPGLQYEGKELWNYDWRGETNSLGYRGSEITRPFKPNTYRVVILGDSVTNGLWIDRYAETFPGVAEAHLSKSEQQVELMNFGVVGYNTLQEVASLRLKGLQFQPHLVVVAYCLNDRERNDGALLARLHAEESNAKGLSSALYHDALIRSALWRAIRFNVLPKISTEEQKEARRRDYNLLARDTVELALGKLADLQKNHAFKTVLMVFPRFGNLHQYKYQMEHDKLERIAKQHDFEFWDLREEFQACEKQSQPLAFDEYHPNVAGHACAGKALAEYISQTILRHEAYRSLPGEP